MQLFYQPDINSTHINPDECLHIIKVLRHNVGDFIHLFDGLGNIYKVRLTEVSKKNCTYEIVKSWKEDHLSNFKINLFIAPTKMMDRMEWMVEKCTEIGLHSITFIHCQRSERKVINVEKIKKTAIAACKQSIKATLPIINNEMVKFEKAIIESNKEKNFIAHLINDSREDIKNHILLNDEINVYIGPEGDFSSEEIEFAINNGVTPVTLGKSRLRTETAGLYVVTAMNILKNS